MRLASALLIASRGVHASIVTLEGQVATPEPEGPGRAADDPPLFPEGYFLAGYTGYVDFVHVKPALTLRPVTALNLMVALANHVGVELRYAW